MPLPAYALAFPDRTAPLFSIDLSSFAYYHAITTPNPPRRRDASRLVAEVATWLAARCAETRGKSLRFAFIERRFELRATLDSNQRPSVPETCRRDVQGGL